MVFNKYGIANIPKRKLSYNTRDAILLTIHYNTEMGKYFNGILDDVKIYDKIQ